MFFRKQAAGWEGPEETPLFCTGCLFVWKELLTINKEHGCKQNDRVIFVSKKISEMFLQKIWISGILDLRFLRCKGSWISGII